MLSNFLIFDIKNGMMRKYKTWIYCLIMCTIVNIIAHYIIMNAIDRGTVATFSDYVLYYTAGSKPFNPLENEAYSIPALWLFQILLCNFMCLVYPLDDLNATGKIRLILSRSRSSFWFAKCIWICCNTLFYYGLFYITSLISCIITGNSICLYASGFTPEIMGYWSERTLEGPYLFGSFYLLIPLTVIAISLVQMTMSLLIGKLYSFLITAIGLLASSYFETSYLLGEYAMPIRSNYFTMNGYDARAGYIYVLSIIVLTSVIGCFIFNKKDIM